MRRFSAVLSTLVLLVLCLCSCSFAEEDGSLVSGDYTYRLQTDGSAILTEYRGSSEYLVVPDHFGEAPVKAIGANAFSHNTSILILELPETLESIGDYAFLYCSSLSYLNLPDSVREIGRNPFAGCESLSDIELSSDHAYLALRDGVLYSLADSLAQQTFLIMKV